MGIPVSVICSAIIGLGLWFTHGAAQEQAKDRAKLLARHYAALYDGQFSAVAQVGRSLANFLSLNPQAKPQRLYSLMEQTLRQDTLISRISMAYEPAALENAPEGLILSVTQRDSELVRQDLAPGYERYFDSDLPWWDVARQGPRWTEPYVDPVRSDGPLCTYSIPIKPDEGDAMGVLSLDVPLHVLQRRVGAQELEADEFFIISREGTFISDQNPDLIMRRTIYQLADASARPELAELGRRMNVEFSGFAEVPARGSSDINWIFFARIRSTGWVFAALVPRSRAMAPAWDTTWYGLIGLAIALLLIAATLWIVARRITQPIRNLAQTVQELAEGNLEAEAKEVTSRDEVGQFARAFNAMIADLRRHVNALTEQTAARQAVESELTVARRIQSSLLPCPEVPCAKRKDLDLSAVNEPVRTVAGDFYDFFELDEDTLIVTIADVSGKGIPAAMFMAVTRTVLRNLAPHCAGPGELLKQANRQLVEDNTGSMYVTLFTAWYHPSRGELRYANAAHPPPYLLGPDSSLRRLGTSTGTVVGLMDAADYEERSERLNPGERLVLYTDGVTEARGPGGVFLEEEGLERILAGCGSLEPEAICRHVVEQVNLFQADEKRTDDVTVLVLQRKA
jgi:sigma-B regulation protein RsbU (phosphoserine phosphatase)